LVDAADGEVSSFFVYDLDSAQSSSFGSWISANAWLSPDGLRLVVEAGYGDRALVVARGGAVLARLPGGGERYAVDHVTWSPDGRLFAFDGGDASGPHLYLARRDGTGLRILTRR